MKRVITTLITLSLIVMIFSGCAKEGEGYSKNFSIGVIQTTEQENKSIITFYDNNLEKVGSKHIGHGSMGSFFDLPKIANDHMYVIPKGIGNQKEKTIVYSLDLKTGTNKEYDLKLQNMNSFYMNEDYLIGVNTWNTVSAFTRLDKKKNQHKKLEIDDVYIERLIGQDDTLYAFGVKKSSKQAVRSSLYVINVTDMSVKAEHQIDGYSHNGAVIVDEKLYFSNSTGTGEGKEELPGTTLGVYNMKDQAFSTIELSVAYPTQILSYNGMLYVVHCNLVTGEGKTVSIVNLNTNKVISTELEHNICQIEVENNTLYAMDGSGLYQYQLNGTEIKKGKEIGLDTVNSRSHYYASCFFIK